MQDICVYLWEDYVNMSCMCVLWMFVSVISKKSVCDFVVCVLVFDDMGVCLWCMMLLQGVHMNFLTPNL